MIQTKDQIRVNKICDEIYFQRLYQADKWADGNVDDLVEQDVARVPFPDAWIQWICRYMGGWNKKYLFPSQYQKEDLLFFREAMVKVAALAIAAIIWVDEKTK